MIVRQETFLTLYTLNEWYSVINGENTYETVLGIARATIASRILFTWRTAISLTSNQPFRSNHEGEK
jgi:hypothetical protein